MAGHRLALPGGYRLENYLFAEAIGKGGFGITYLARDLQLNRPVAVKELLPDSIATRVDRTTVVAQSEAHEADWEWARDRFLREAQVVAGFRHPNIVSVHRLIEANGTVYMVMDFLDGGSYEARLARIEREPDESSLRAVIDPLLDGLAEVHKAGLLHRDIKPDNILFNHRGQPVLADFGAARELVRRTITLTSIITPGYSPLEQYQSKDGLQGAWTDIYALGAVMARAITGKRPPPATDRLGKDEFQALGSKPREGFSSEFLKAVDLALRMKPEERPQSVEAWRKKLTTTAKPPEPALTMVAPKGGERWETGTEQKIRWKSNAASAGRVGIKSVDVELWKGGELVEKIATGMELTAPYVSWKISTETAAVGGCQVKLVGRDTDGNDVASCLGKEFAIIPKRVLADSKSRTQRQENAMEKVVQFVAGAAFLWLVFFGGWKVVWPKIFPHLPQPMIGWMRDKAPTWVPESERLRPGPILKLDFDKIKWALPTPSMTTPRYFQGLHPLDSPTGTPSLKDLGFNWATPTPGKGYFGSKLLAPSPTPAAGNISPVFPGQ